MKDKLKNRKAVITGGSRGIGKAIAKIFLENQADVFLVARDIRELEATQRELLNLGRVETLAADVSRAEEVDLIARKIKEIWNHVDILVNAAGILGPIGPLLEASPAEWKKVIEVNLFGTFLMIRALAPFMKSRGRIINFVGGGDGAYPNFSAYVASKGGIGRLTETVAVELKDSGVDVNAIAPGAVNTKMLDDLLYAGPGKAGRANYDRAVKQKSEGGVSPEKAATLVLFLASDAAHGLTGKIISAVWDNYVKFPEHLKEIMSSDLYNYRRVKPQDRGYNWY